MRYETNGNSLTLEETSNGYLENVKLEGRTLVNLWGNKSSDFLLSGQATFNEEAGYIEITSTSQRYSNVFTKYTENLKPSTLYTIIVDVLENTFTNIPILRVSSADSTTDNNNSCFNEPKVINGGETGRFIFKLTTISDFSNVNVGLRTFVGNDNAEIGCKLKFRIIILEGDYTQNPPNYFEGLKSVGEDVEELRILSLNSDGNLLHCEDFSVTGSGVTLSYDSFNQEFTLNGTCTANNTTLFYPSTVNKRSLVGAYSGRLTLLNQSMGNLNVRFYNSDFSRGVVLNNKKLTHTGNFGEGDRVTFSVRVDNGQTFNNDKFKVCFNKGNTPIPHRPYKEHIKEILYKDVDGIWKKPILRGINGSIRDVYDSINLKFHKKCKTITLNGSENWTLNKTMGNKLQFLVIFSGIKTGKVLCDKFSYTHNDESKECIWVYNNEKIVIHIDISKLETQDVEGFKKWLKANPVKVVYQLAEEQIYECLPISLASYKGETTYRVESGFITPTSSFELDYTLSNAVARVSDVKAFNNAMKDNLKNNLIDKGVDALKTDKISHLVNKTKTLIKPEGTLPPEYALKGRTFINSEGRLLTGTAREVKTSVPTYSDSEYIFTPRGYSVSMSDTDRTGIGTDEVVCNVGALAEGTSKVSYTLRDNGRISSAYVGISILNEQKVQVFLNERRFGSKPDETVSIEVPCKDGYTLQLSFIFNLSPMYVFGSGTLADLSWSCDFVTVK